MSTIRHIIDVVRKEEDKEQSKYTFDETELDEMLALLGGLEEKNIQFSHRWEVVE